MLVSSRRDRAVVTGCLAYRGDPKERAVNASTGTATRLRAVSQPERLPGCPRVKCRRERFVDRKADRVRPGISAGGIRSEEDR